MSANLIKLKEYSLGPWGWHSRHYGNPLALECYSPVYKAQPVYNEMQ
jgi:hypothetical protein